MANQVLKEIVKKKIKPVTKYFAGFKVNLHEERKCILCQSAVV